MAKKKRKSGRQRRPQSRQRASGRFTAGDKAKILEEVDRGKESQVAIAARYDMHPVTLSRWKTARDKAREEGDSSGISGLEPKSTRPLNTTSPVSGEERELVIQTRDEHPEMGTAQIRNHLRRFHGVRLSHKVIGRILKEAGFELEKRVSDTEAKVVERFEMSRPNELWTMDITEFWIHDLKLRLIDIVDDYSRFIVGHGLFRQTTATDAISVLQQAIASHGKPERVLTDRGPEFHAWKGTSAFTQFLEGEMIEHSIARPHHPQTLGKIEAVHGTLKKELLGVVRFDSFAHAQREIAGYFERYNFERTHMGIGGLTPADRYFGRAEQVMSLIEKRCGALDRGDAARLPGERAVVFQLALVEGRLELWFAGKRFELG
jgi:putative transposase